MADPDPDERLSRIETQWTALVRAHGPADEATAARNKLVLRYSGSVYRYLLGAVRDPDVAADLCQEFAVRFLRGDFHRAAPDRGRFRNYVKTALCNLINDHHRSRQAGPMPLAAEAPAPDPMTEIEFVGEWRQSILDQTWKRLGEVNPVFHAVLHLRIEYPEMPSGEMADRLAVQLARPLTAENVRKSLQRAHAKFAELLLDQVTDSLQEPTTDDIESELQTLDLLRYCRGAWEKRKSGA
ncbi:MAG TPA: sigma-70 family RNA polymerase sigma factor [Fimbriiglobus sp.]